MSAYRLVAEPAVDADVEAAFHWYENESPGLGLYFAVDEATIVVLTVLHAHRDPAEWQKWGG